MNAISKGYTLDEIIEQSGLGRTSIYKAISEGRLKARKFGRRVVIFDTDYSDFITNLPVIDRRSSAA
jgi:excisionase family DNA binding protein